MSRSYGGNRVGRSAPPAFTHSRARYPSAATAQQSGCRDVETVRCDVCGLDVKGSDGIPALHRVGSKRTGRWPCPGGKSAAERREIGGQ